MSSLSERLARLRASGNAPQARSSEEAEISNPVPEPAIQSAMPRRRRNAARLGTNDNASKTSSVDNKPGVRRSGVDADTRPPGGAWEVRQDFFWERVVDYPALFDAVPENPFVLPPDCRSHDLIYYDLETTGLSGGAGNTAFLIGLGYHSGDSFRVHQLFLSDYPGEEAMLRRYIELCGDNRPQVSYNGRSFDSQVLKTRFLLNRLPPSLPAQIDLLYPSRRLWKSALENVTLRMLETQVLNFHRIDDLPGSEAPDAWFEWLSGSRERINGVFRHNADDIVSLARLTARLEEWGCTEPGESILPAGTPASCWGMAVQWSFRDPAKERRWLEEGRRRGEPRCAMELALRYRREGQLHQSKDIWEDLIGREPESDAAVELAKYWEHQEKDPRRALELLRPLEDRTMTPRQRDELNHRRLRLELKIRKQEESPR